MNVEFRRTFVKDLEKVESSRLKQRVREVILAVEGAQTLAEVANVRKLRDGDFYYRIRIGDYRIGLTWQGETVVFVRFLHRKDLYRYFP
jgi:mRNA interferase RelE/StbE